MVNPKHSSTVPTTADTLVTMAMNSSRRSTGYGHATDGTAGTVAIANLALLGSGWREELKEDGHYGEQP